VSSAPTGFRPGGTDPLSDAVAGEIVALAPNGIVLVDPDGNVVLANRQAEEMFGYDAAELLGRPIEALVPPELRHGHEAHRQGYAADPRTRPMGSGLDLRAARRDGSTFPVEIALSPIDVDGRRHVVAIVRDITDRRQAERQLQAARAELSVLEDRERIARDLHDTVIQRLFAAGMSLQAAAAQSSPEVQHRVGGVVDELDTTIREIRQAIFRLTAHNLDDSSLRRRLVAVVDEAEEPLAFAPEVRFDGPIETVDEARAEHLLAVLREALSNVARHARATHVQVRVSVSDRLELVVTDDGVGIPPDVVPGGGTVNLRERAEGLGGAFLIEPGAPRGTVLRWTVPLD
jgi:PAS domain S-box-containing protein